MGGRLLYECSAKKIVIWISAYAGFLPVPCFQLLPQYHLWNPAVVIGRNKRVRGKQIFQIFLYQKKIRDIRHHSKKQCE
jgi:hypothetical protein